MFKPIDPVEDYEVFRKRLRYGWPEREALSVPVKQPRWWWRIEQKTGRPLRQSLTDHSRQGGTLRSFSRDHGVVYQTLRDTAEKLGVSFPKSRAA